MNIHIHALAQAQLSGTAVGTIVTDVPRFRVLLEEAVSKAAFPDNGQGFIPLPPEARKIATSGVALRTEDPKRFVHRLHRGVVGSFLRRDLLADEDLSPDSVLALVYTQAAFMADPQVTDEMKSEAGDSSHVLITVLASKGPPPQLSPERFIANLAGGNNEQLAMTGDQIRAQAKLVDQYARTWCVVG